jgi:hypothetical protein
MLNLGFRVAVMSLLILLSGWTIVCQTSVPRNWQKFDADGLFTFYLPPGMKRGDMAGVESFLREYLDSEKRFLFIYEPYSYLSYDSRRSIEMKDYQETETKIGDRKAVIHTYHTTDENAYYSNESGQTTYVAELHVGDWAKSEVELFMSLESKSSANFKFARRIFSSVEFTKDKGTHNKSSHLTADSVLFINLPCG